MDELFEKLNALSVEELEKVIAKARELIQEKRQDVERKKQEEIARLQQRLKELQAEVQGSGQEASPSILAPVSQDALNMPAPAPAPVAPTPAPVAAPAAPPRQGMVPCPHCHQLLPVGSKFCFYCGGDATPRPGGGATAAQRRYTTCPACHARVPADSRFCEECGQPL